MTLNIVMGEVKIPMTPQEVIVDEIKDVNLSNELIKKDNFIYVNKLEMEVCTTIESALSKAKKENDTIRLIVSNVTREVLDMIGYINCLCKLMAVSYSIVVRR